MTMPAFAPAPNPFAADPNYYLGRADAYDHSQDRSVDEMVALMSMAVDYAPVAYAVGYSDRVTELRLELDAVAPMEMELAQTTHARRQGRETSTLHTRNHRSRKDRAA